MTSSGACTVAPPQPPLSDGVVTLRPWREDDAPALAAAADDPDVARWLPDLPSPYTLADAEAYITARPAGFAAGTDLAFAACDADGLVGSAGIPRRDPRNGVSEVGYWIAAGARGRGLATRAVRLLVAWAFDGLGDGRVELMAGPHNLASCRVAEKAGLRREGVLRGREATRDGGRRDLVVYGLTAAER